MAVFLFALAMIQFAQAMISFVLTDFYLEICKNQLAVAICQLTLINSSFMLLKSMIFNFHLRHLIFDLWGLLITFIKTVVYFFLKPAKLLNVPGSIIQFYNELFVPQVSFRQQLLGEIAHPINLASGSRFIQDFLGFVYPLKLQQFESKQNINIVLYFYQGIPIMIDLLKNYKQLNNATGYLGSVRYYLAKKKLDTLFVKWLMSNKDNVESLLTKAKNGQLRASEYPPPLFPPRVNLAASLSPLNNSSSINFSGNSTITPPRRRQMNQQNRRVSFNETYNPNLGKSAILGKSLTIHQEIKIDTEKIPQFYFPEGKPVDPGLESTIKDELNTIFGTNQSIDQNKCMQLVSKLLNLPGYFAIMLIKKYGKQPKKLTKQEFLQYWKQSSAKCPHKKAFTLLLNPTNKKYLQIDDFKQILKTVMQIHPGLQFLKSSPEFQDFYSICVINRMFYMANHKNDYQMTYRQFKNSNILKSFYDIEADPQINSNRDYFCYQDFYVIYIKFWQLDSSHRYLLSKQQFSKYSSYTLSRKTIDRIFSQKVKKFQDPELMTFGDFVWFIICAEDKTTRQSIEYWFRILDLDGDGIVSGYELEYFFEEQNQRYGDMQNSSTDFNYENTICQMFDLLKPPHKTLQFTLQDFLHSPKQIGIFINILTDLNKMLAYDQRDAYEDRAFRTNYPDWTDWDRFARPQYKRVEAMDQGAEGEEVINWENDQ